MKANELMVGDFVMMGKKIYRCANICGHTNDVLLDNGVITNAGNLSPIHLTSEILEKIGFRLHKFNGDIMRGMWWEIPEFVIRENMIDSIGRNNFEYKYVHQLQHALKLCGTEKEIEL